jgi:RHS repeat-associated protein
VRIFNGSGVQIQESQVGNIFGFTGREFDSESHLYYYRARYYAPGIGRFLSADPIGFDSKDSNFYRYVFNNPLKYTDPQGLSPCSGLIGILACGVAIAVVVHNCSNGENNNSSSSSGDLAQKCEDDNEVVVEFCEKPQNRNSKVCKQERKSCDIN